VAAEQEHPVEERARAEAARASDNMNQSPQNPRFGIAISGFLDRIKPFRELIALIVAVSVSISGAMSWAITYFATRSDMSHLECRLIEQLYSQVTPVRTDSGMNDVKWRRSMANHLLDQNSDESRRLAKSLLEEADYSQTDQEKRDRDALEKFAEIMQKCIAGSPPTSVH
jgi:hypothetical protein